METLRSYPCKKCGQSFSDSGLFAAHPCSDYSNKQSVSYKCSQCSEAFSKPGVLKHHFRSTHSALDPVGPFPCTEQDCEFISAERQEYQAHLVSTHGLTLTPCTLQSCKVSFLTQAEMERHLKGHMPFGCFQCQFVTQNVKNLNNHLLQHNRLPAQGNQTSPNIAPGTNVNQPKRKLNSNPDCPSLPENSNEEPPVKHKTKRVRKAAEGDKPSAVASAPRPSKEYLAEGSEHIYRTHTCPKCRRCFKMRSHLQEHLHLHFPDPSLQCPTCKRYFTSKSKLRIHRLREAGEKVHHCHLCEYSAVERNAIRRHLVSVHAEDAGESTNSLSYPCPTCGQRFNQSKLLKAHMKTHNILPDNKPLACFQEGCSFQTSLCKELIRHTAEVHGLKAFGCRHHVCGAVFQSEADMEAHYRTHLAYHCTQCDFSCSNKAIFLQHQRHGHPGNDELSCDFCSFVTFNPVEFEQHIGHLHANEKIHRCSQCSYVTSHKRGLKRHMLMHSGDKPHKCIQCDFRCRDESYLSRHMLTHSDNKNFMCAECGYVTKWKHYLNVHMRKHAGDLRYQCDQCPYRCHRMDQLNSHKLRHQAKSLMCEICAYACKRKYELRNHMLAKHSGEDKEPSVYKCKYCTYTTCYRQALQNHENCKHTKLKEFRCALCTYSSFSSVSLFLHKRKVHGYIPGDKAWLENYAAKEKERNCSEFLKDFYTKPSSAPEQSEQSASEGPEQPASADHSRETVACAQTSDSANVFDVVAQEVVQDGISESSPSVHNPEEYCTLVLTTVSNTDYQTASLQNEKDQFADQTSGSPNFTCNVSDMSQERANLSTSSSDGGDGAVADPESEQSEVDDDYQHLTNTSQQAEPGECRQIQTPEEQDYAGSVGSAFMNEQSQSLESELRLKAMRKHDKDQAEAMVLEGRVQMLVVPTKDVYRCDKCSYVTGKESTLRYHCEALCRSRIKGHKCQACGAQFKQRRGLDSHLAKKCPAVPRKTRTFVGVANTRVVTDDSTTVGEEGPKQPDEGTPVNSHQTEPLSSQDRICTDSIDQEFHHEEAAETSGLQSCEGLAHNGFTSSESVHQQNKGNVLKVKPAKKQIQRNESLYTEKDGKFKCRLCSFSSVKLATVERHLSTCRKSLKKNLLEVEEESGKESVKEKVDLVEEHNERTNQKFSCPGCSFRCSQKRALTRHEKRGCLKRGEVQCTSCSFVAKSKPALTRHVLCVHNKRKFGVAKPKRLHCQHCVFTCKQDRCMAQHVALKHKGVRPHRCHFCPFSTTRRYRLEEHESLHTGVGRHRCDLCDKTFGALTKLRQHKIRIHDKQPSHFCSLCDFSGYSQDDVRRHKLRCHAGEQHHACTHCDAQFSSEVALRNHCKRAHQLKVCFSCKQCDYACSSDVALKNHQESKHPQVKCSTCKESFTTKESLLVHQRSHLAHQCQLCAFGTKSRQLLAQHLLSEHEEGPAEDKPLRCSTCQFACRHQLVLEQHLRSHGGKRLYKCTDCEYSTRNKQKITWHIRIHTGEKPYSCELCSYTCTDPSRLKLHMRVHQEEKKYLCPQCGYKCKWATQLKYHMTKHTGDKPYACDECDYRTNRADALRAHRDTQHCDVRAYVCEKCGKAFKTSFILKTHQRQHSDDRPYTCGLCHKAFRWPAGLRHHYLSHTKQQPFCCRLCPYRAKQKFQVVKHLQRHHPQASVEQGVVRDSEAGSLTLKEALQGALDQRAAEVEDEGAQEAAEEATQRGQ